MGRFFRDQAKFLSAAVLAVTIAFLAIVPLLVSGATEGPSKSTATEGPTKSAGNLSFKLQNPLAFDSIEDFIVAILNVVIVLMTPIVVIFIIFAGFKYVTARGNSEKIGQATQSLTYAIIGGVLIIGAVAIAQIIKNLVTAFGAS
jgi:hypothetical protein